MLLYFSLKGLFFFQLCELIFHGCPLHITPQVALVSSVRICADLCHSIS